MLMVTFRYEIQSNQITAMIKWPNRDKYEPNAITGKYEKERKPLEERFYKTPQPIAPAPAIKDKK
jgi:hypothetical protein